MRRLTLAELSNNAALLDSLVLQTHGIDRFCSSSLWTLPAYEAIMPRGLPWIWQSDAGFINLVRYRLQSGETCLLPLEAAWNFASPLISAQPAQLAAELLRVLYEHQDQWDFCVLSGIAQGSELFMTAAQTLAPYFDVRQGDATSRYVAHLEDGVEGFLARRSANFRHAIHRTRAKAQSSEFVFENVELKSPDTAAHAYDEILAIEALSWKGQSDTGLATPQMRDFYALMLPRMVERQAARLIFAHYQGRKVGYLLGGVMGNTYRALQFSFDNTLRSFGVGNLMQIAQMELLCKEAHITRYDLGSDVEYKKRWGDELFSTHALVVAHAPNL